VVSPFASEGMIAVLLREWFVLRQKRNRGEHQCFQVAFVFPDFSRLKSRLKMLVRSIVRIQVGHQIGDIAERREFAGASLPDGRFRCRIGDLYVEG